MARPSGPKTRNGKQWTEARFNSFITSNLRRTTMRWAPIANCLKGARLSFGIYRCAQCKQEVPASIKVGGKRVKNVHVDHIIPAIDPDVGFVSWDSFINRLFCEADNLQVLCHECHMKKSDEEKAIAKARRERNKELDDIEVS